MDDLKEELSAALSRLQNVENLCSDWKTKEANYVKTQCELISKNQALQAQNHQLNSTLSQVQYEYQSFKESHHVNDDKIAALRSVARALESENQLLTTEKDHLVKFKRQFCQENGALSAAVDQIDTLRRQMGSKDEELRAFNKQFEYQEVEKIKIVQKLAQVEQDLDLKSHELRKTKSQLGDKEDTLEALRAAKRDVELRLQTQMSESINLREKLSRFQRTEEQLEALQAELVMQESIYESKMKDMQMELNQQIDAINQIKESEMESLKIQYANLFDEKAQESARLKMEYDQSLRKLEQQSRNISDLEFKEKELNALLSKKQACHHREFDKTYKDMENEIDFLRELSRKSETELASLITQFKALQSKTLKQLQFKDDHEDQDSGFLHNSSSSTSQDASIESTTSESVRNYPTKKRRGKKKKK